MLPFLAPAASGAGPSHRTSPQAAILCTIASPRASCQERTAALYELEVSLKDELCDAQAITSARRRMHSQGGWAEVAPALLANLSRLHVHLSYLSTTCAPCSARRDADAARALLAAEAGVCFSLLQGLALLAPGERGDRTEIELLLALASAPYWAPATTVDLSHAPAHAISTISVLLLARPESLSSFTTLRGEAVLRSLLCAQENALSEQQEATAAAASELLAHLADREGAERLAAEELRGSARGPARRGGSDASSSRSTSASSGTDDDGPKTPTDHISFDVQRTPRKASLPKVEAPAPRADDAGRTPRQSAKRAVVIHAVDAGEAATAPALALPSSPTKRIGGHSGTREGVSRMGDMRTSASLMGPPMVPSKSSSLRLAVPVQSGASRSAPSTPRRRGGTVPSTAAVVTAGTASRGRTLESPQRQSLGQDLESDQQEMVALVSASPAVRRAHARSLSPTKPVPMRALPSLPNAAEDAEVLSGRSSASGRLAALQKSRPLLQRPSRSRSPDGGEARRRDVRGTQHAPRA